MSPAQKPTRSRKPPTLGQSRTKPWVRIVVVAVVVVLAIGTLGLLLVDTGSDDTTTSTTSTRAGVASAAGKPCVAVSDPLPAGAPAVPVPAGPPPTELVKQDLQPGTGATVVPGATVTIDYIGVSCSTGKIFDSSYSTGQPVSYPLSRLIPGWQEGIPGMKVGGVRLLGIPPDLAYGSQGRAPAIAPDETLWFVVTVKDAPVAG